MFSVNKCLNRVFIVMKNFDSEEQRSSCDDSNYIEVNLWIVDVFLYGDLKAQWLFKDILK